MGADYLIIESDISNEDSVKDIYSAVLERYGKIDILVNNAADGDMDGLDTIEKITQTVIDDSLSRITIIIGVSGCMVSRKAIQRMHQYSQRCGDSWRNVL